MNQFLRLLGALLGVAAWVTVPVCGQGVRFSQRYPLTPGVGLSLAVSALPTPTGYLVGGDVLTPAFTRELWLAQLDSAGTLTRQRIYRSDSASYGGRALLALPSGEYVQAVVKSTYGTILRRNAMLWWYNAQGDSLRATSYPAAPYGMIPNYVCRVASGGFVIVGSIAQTPNANYTFSDWFAIGTDARGRERWRRTWHLLGDGFALNATAAPDGGALITGIARPQLQGGDPFFRNHLAAVKIDSVGTTEWQRVYADSTGGWSPVCLSDGGYLIGGFHLTMRTPVRALGRVSLYRLDSAGNLLRRRDYGPEMDVAQPMRMHQLPDSSLVLGGGSSDSSQLAATGGYYAVTGFGLKLCPDGDSVWWRTYRYYTNPYCNNYLWDLVPTPDGGFAGAGWLHGRAGGGASTEAWVFKTDADGYVTAGGAPSGVVCRPVGLPGEGDTPAPVQVWPNPAPDGRFRLGGALPGTAYRVLDALGRVVATGTVRAAEPELDLGAQAPGLYLLRLTWPGGRTGTCKLLR